MNEIIFTPNAVQLSKHFGVPYETLLRWKKTKSHTWRHRMYVYLVDRYKKEMK